MPKKVFITGIGTDVGKTIAAAIVVEALQADYFKPIQAGDLEYSDTDKVQKLVSNSISKFHPNAYALATPMSPHAAANIDGVTIDIDKITLPKTENTIVIEGAGGLLVPLNDTQTILDIIQSDYKVIIVSRHYLGSINHTLMTIQLIQERGHEVAILFNGAKHETTEEIISKMTGVTVLGRIDEEPYIDTNVVKEYSELFFKSLQIFLQC